MSSFTLKIKLGNEAMQTDDDISSALKEVAYNVESGITSGKIFDLNGNSVGTYQVK
jgi:hypothetical protein